MRVSVADEIKLYRALSVCGRNRRFNGGGPFSRRSSLGVEEVVGASEAFVSSCIGHHHGSLHRQQ